MSIKWTPARKKKLRQVVLMMIAAHSAYETFGRGWEDRAPRDPFKKTRLKDFAEAAEVGKELLLEVEAGDNKTK